MARVGACGGTGIGPAAGGTQEEEAPVPTKISDGERQARREADREKAAQAVEALTTSEGWQAWLAGLGGRGGRRGPDLRHVAGAAAQSQRRCTASGTRPGRPGRRMIGGKRRPGGRSRSARIATSLSMRARCTPRQT
jgi:hypothetical protein